MTLNLSCAFVLTLNLAVLWDDQAQVFVLLLSPTDAPTHAALAIVLLIVAATVGVFVCIFGCSSSLCVPSPEPRPILTPTRPITPSPPSPSPSPSSPSSPSPASFSPAPLKKHSYWAFCSRRSWRIWVLAATCAATATTVGVFAKAWHFLHHGTAYRDAVATSLRALREGQTDEFWGSASPFTRALGTFVLHRPGDTPKGSYFEYAFLALTACGMALVALSLLEAAAGLAGCEDFERQRRLQNLRQQEQARKEQWQARKEEQHRKRSVAAGGASPVGGAATRAATPTSHGARQEVAVAVNEA